MIKNALGAVSDGLTNIAKTTLALLFLLFSANFVVEQMGSDYLLVVTIDEKAANQFRSFPTQLQRRVDALLADQTLIASRLTEDPPEISLSKHTGLEIPGLGTSLDKLAIQLRQILPFAPPEISVQLTLPGPNAAPVVSISSRNISTKLVALDLPKNTTLEQSRILELTAEKVVEIVDPVLISQRYLHNNRLDESRILVNEVRSRAGYKKSQLMTLEGLYSETLGRTLQGKGNDKRRQQAREDAQRLFNYATTDDPDDPVAAYYIAYYGCPPEPTGYCQSSAASDSDAQHWQRAISLADQHPKIRIAYAAGLARNDLQSASREFESILAGSDPKFSSLILNEWADTLATRSGNRRKNSAQWEAAISRGESLSQRSRDIDPGNYYSWVIKAKLEYYRGDYSSAVNSMQRAASLAPRYSFPGWAYHIEAESLTALGRYREAIAVYEEQAAVVLLANYQKNWLDALLAASSFQLEGVESMWSRFYQHFPQYQQAYNRQILQYARMLNEEQFSQWLNRTIETTEPVKVQRTAIQRYGVALADIYTHPRSADAHQNKDSFAVKALPLLAQAKKEAVKNTELDYWIYRSVARLAQSPDYGNRCGDTEFGLQTVYPAGALSSGNCQPLADYLAKTTCERIGRDNFVDPTDRAQMLFQIGKDNVLRQRSGSAAGIRCLELANQLASGYGIDLTPWARLYQISGLVWSGNYEAASGLIEGYEAQLQATIKSKRARKSALAGLNFREGAMHVHRAICEDSEERAYNAMRPLNAALLSSPNDEEYARYYIVASILSGEDDKAHQRAGEYMRQHQAQPEFRSWLSYWLENGSYPLRFEQIKLPLACPLKQSESSHTITVDST